MFSSFDEKTSSFRWQANECNCYSTRMVNLVEQSEAHVIVLFLGLFLLLLLLGGLSSRSRGSTTSSRSASSLEDGGNLLGGDGNIVIGEDEGGVDAGKFRV